MGHGGDVASLSGTLALTRRVGDGEMGETRRIIPQSTVNSQQSTVPIPHALMPNSPHLYWQTNWDRDS
jgi:hypothetical protein